MTVLRSFLYALLSSSPVVVFGMGIIMIVASVGIDPGSYLIASTEFISQYEFFYSITRAFFRYTVAASIMGYGLSAIVFFVFLRIINPNFFSKTYRKEQSISRWQLLALFLLSIIFIALVGYLASLIHPLLPVVSTILLMWLLWHRYGLWGSFLQCSKDRAKRISLFRRPLLPDERHFLAVGIRGVIMIVCAISFTLFAGIPLGFLLFHFNAFGIEDPWLSQNTFFVWILLSFFFLGASSLPLAYVLADVKVSWREMLVRCIVPFLLLIGVGTLQIGVVNFFEKHDYLKRFHTAIGMETTPAPPQQIIIFGVDGGHIYNRPSVTASVISYTQDLTIEDILRKAEYWDVTGRSGSPATLDSFSIPCSGHNLKKAGEWLSGNKESSLVMPLLWFLGDCYRQTWEVDQLLRVRYWGVQRTQSIIAALHLISKRKALAQENSLHIRYLQLLGQDPLTRINEKGKQRIQEILDHYAFASTVRGYISGRLFIHEKPTARLTVGLFMDSHSKEEIKNGAYNYGEWMDKPIEKYLVASTKTDPYGRFFFPNLKADTYYLGLILPDSFSVSTEDIALQTERVVHAIVVDEQARSHALGSITIAEKGKITDTGSGALQDGKDTDVDGLLDEEEKYYGTNASLADTDEDGFSDFDELNGGYDPLRKNGVRYYPKNLHFTLTPS